MFMAHENPPFVQRTPDPELAGRLESFDALYEACHRRAFGLAFLLLRDVQDAEDIVQAAFLSVWRSGIPSDRQSTTARSWVLAIVRNRAIDRLRARRRHPEVPLDEIPDRQSASDVAHEVAGALDTQAICEALHALPWEQRQVVDLAYFSGLTHVEIASRLRLPLGTVKGRLRLALDHLRARFTSSRRLSISG